MSLIQALKSVLKHGVTSPRLHVHDEQWDRSRFRLVKRSKKTGKFLEFSLYSASLKHPPEYIAVSYAWNAKSDNPTTDRADTRVICNGHAVDVRENLLLALQIIDFEDCFLWVDVLCMDQHNLMTRSAEILKMGEIYLKAHHTVVWLGSEQFMSYTSFSISKGVTHNVETNQPRLLYNVDPEKPDLPALQSLKVLTPNKKKTDDRVRRALGSAAREVWTAILAHGIPIYHLKVAVFEPPWRRPRTIRERLLAKCIHRLKFNEYDEMSTQRVLDYEPSPGYEEVVYNKAFRMLKELKALEKAAWESNRLPQDTENYSPELLTGLESSGVSESGSRPFLSKAPIGAVPRSMRHDVPLFFIWIPLGVLYFASFCIRHWPGPHEDLQHRTSPLENLLDLIVLLFLTYYNISKLAVAFFPPLTPRRWIRKRIGMMGETNLVEGRKRVRWNCVSHDLYCKKVQPVLIYLLIKNRIVESISTMTSKNSGKVLLQNCNMNLPDLNYLQNIKLFMLTLWPQEVHTVIVTLYDKPLRTFCCLYQPCETHTGIMRRVCHFMIPRRLQELDQ